MKSGRQNSWNWFSVKLLFEFVLSGEPDKDSIDQNYTNQYKNYEEILLLVRAQSFDHAYKIAEKKARKMETEYRNPYGETVHMNFVEAIDCFSISDEMLLSGTEVYSRFLKVPKDVNTKDFIDRYYPDTVKDNSGIENHYVLRNREFQ